MVKVKSVVNIIRYEIQLPRCIVETYVCKKTG